jgi:integrase/recombinase XerD
MILDACGRLRDRLLFAVLYDTGMRIGEALGLRHEDIAAAEREVTVFPRHNANGARTKSANTRIIPVSAELVRLYADYLHEEYGDLDSDYVLSGYRDNTYCPETAVMPATHGKRGCARESSLAVPA